MRKREVIDMTTQSRPPDATTGRAVSHGALETSDPLDRHRVPRICDRRSGGARHLHAEFIRQPADCFPVGHAWLPCPASPDCLAPQVASLGRVDQRVVALPAHDDHRRPCTLPHPNSGALWWDSTYRASSMDPGTSTSKARFAFVRQNRAKVANKLVPRRDSYGLEAPRPPHTRGPPPRPCRRRSRSPNQQRPTFTGRPPLLPLPPPR